MAKFSSKSRRKGHRALESKDLSNVWEEEVAPLGRRLASVKKKLLVSIYKLLVTSVLILIGLCQRAIGSVKQRIVTMGQKIIRQFHRVRLATKRLCQRGVGAVKLKVVAVGLNMVKKYHRIRIKTIRAYRSSRDFCWQAIEPFKLKTVRQYSRIRIRTTRAYKPVAILMTRTRRSLVRHSRQTIGVAKFKLVSAGRKTVRQHHRIRIAIGRATIWFVRFCRQSIAAVQRQIILAGQRVSNDREYVGAFSRKKRAVNQNFKRQYLRTLVRTRRAFLNCTKLLHRGIKSFRRGLRFVQLKVARWYPRALVIIRRVFRNFVRQYRQVRASSRQTVLKQYQETIQATNQIDSALELEAKKEQRALARAREKMTSSWKNAAKKARKKIDDIGHGVSTSFQAAGEWVSKSLPQRSLKRVAACVKKVTEFSEYKKVKKMAVEHSTWVPFKQIGSFFSDFAQKRPIRDRIAKSNGLKILLDLGLIIGVSFYVLIITYLVNGKYKSFNPLNSPSIALGGMSLGSGNHDNSPPLALISYSPKPKLAASLAPCQQTCCPKRYSFWPKRITLRHVEGWGEGVSFGTDYSTLALLFAPDYRVGRIMPMLDLRGHRFDNNTYAANIGIAARYIPGSSACCPNRFCQILGLNVFWDWREGRLGSFQQIGAGLEVLGTRWDLRANVYAPISVKKRRRTCRFDYEGGFFVEHRRCEFTSYGYNAEIGYYVIRGCDFFLYAAGGPYYLVRKCHTHTRGGEFRLRPQYKDYLALDFSVSYDNVFKTVYQAQVIFYLPLYQLSKCLNKRPCCLSDQQIYQPIERFEVMPLGRRSCWQRNF